MKKKLTGWLIFLSIPLISSSQITCKDGEQLVKITISQLRQINEVFVEHKFLLSENTTLSRQIKLLDAHAQVQDNIIANQKKQLDISEKIALTQNIQLDTYKSIHSQYRKEKRRNTAKWFCCGIVAGVLMMVVL